MGTDVILLRANLLGGMNSYILENIGDENILEFWFAEGVPDCCDIDTLMEIAKDEELFASICVVFGNILNTEVLGVK